MTNCALNTSLLLGVPRQPTEAPSTSLLRATGVVAGKLRPRDGGLDGVSGRTCLSPKCGGRRVCRLPSITTSVAINSFFSSDAKHASERLQIAFAFVAVEVQLAHCALLPHVLVRIGSCETAHNNVLCIRLFRSKVCTMSHINKTN